MSIFNRVAPRLGMSSTRAPARLAAVKRHMSSSAPAMAANSGGKEVGVTLDENTDKVLYESIGGTRIYKLNRPKALNALDWDMIASLAKNAQLWRESDLCKLVIGRGDERAFCAGGDVVDLVKSRGEHGGKYALSFFKDEFQVNWEMGRIGKPYVAIIDGFTMGGGAGISLPAGVRVATKKTVFAMPETKIGYAPDVAGNYYISQLDGEIGAWLAMTGQELWGRAAYELGIATHYVEPSSIPSLVEQLSQLENPTLEQVSKLVADYHVTPPPAGTEPSSKASREGPSPITGEIRAFLDKTFGLPSIQEIYAALKAAEADSSSPEVAKWAKEQRELMDHRSPTGMAVALENFKLAQKAKRLNTVLDNDMLMATGFVGTDRKSEEFTTGVTHLLINKGKGRADWNPSSIDDKAVTPAEIKNNFFDKKAPHLAECPAIEYIPTPSKKEGPDSTWGQFRAFGLPSEAEIRAWVKGESKGSGAFKLKENELVQRVIDARGEQGGPRVPELTARTVAIAKAHCKADGEGYLNWRD